MSSRGLSVVVPVFRSEQSLRPLREHLISALEALQRPFEILLVEDGGGDGSWHRIVEFAGEDPRVRGLRMARNVGQHSALLAGTRAAIYDVIVTLDDDLQHPPAEIEKLVRKLDEGFDVVYGHPQLSQHNVWRRIASLATRIILQHALGMETAKRVSSFRAFKTEIRDAFADYRSPYVFLDVLLTWGADRITFVDVRHEPRVHGASGYTVRKLVRHAANLITGFSSLPLRLASVLGFAMAFVGVTILAFVLLRYLIADVTVPGFAFLACTISIFSGVQLFALGVIGEYVARIHFRTMDRPPYVVREITAHNDSSEQS
jgi:glycosyltransferase involved in cell wall biosynthesis